MLLFQSSFFFITIDEWSNLDIPLYVIILYETSTECDTRFRKDIFPVLCFKMKLCGAECGCGTRQR